MPLAAATAGIVADLLDRPTIDGRFLVRVRSFTAGALTALLFTVLAGADAWAASTRRITFKNNTGQAVNDLHVEFVQASTPNPPGGPFGAFPNENGSGTTKIDFSGGVVPKNGSTSITFTSSSSRIKVKRWWWTLDGVRVGSIQGEKVLAIVGFDQDSLRLSELATISLDGMADFGLDAKLAVNYTIATPSGASFSLGPVALEIGAGQETHQQLLAGPLTELGTYTLTYSAVDEETGDVVSEGTSAVAVDSGTRPRSGL